MVTPYPLNYNIGVPMVCRDIHVLIVHFVLSILLSKVAVELTR